MNKLTSTFALLALVLGLFIPKSQAQVSGGKPELIMYRHNGGGISPAPVVAGNLVGTIKWNGLTAIGNIQTGASIKSTAISVAPGSMVSNMVFSTQGVLGLTERAIITETGLVGIGTLAPQYHLDIVGNTHTSGRFYGRIHFDVAQTTDLPNTYNDEAYFERKSRAQLGLAANAYANGGILSLSPGGGGLDRQLFSGGDDGFWTRSQNPAGTNDWAIWEKILTSGDISGTPNRIARFLPPGPVSSEIGDSQLFDDGTNVGIGTTTPDAAYLLTVGGDTRVNGNLRATGNASVDGNSTTTGTTTTSSLNVGANALVNGNTNTGSLNVGGNALVNGNASTNGLSVINNASVGGNLGVGKLSTGFDLDVAGASNFDGRVKIGAASFPTSTDYSLAVGGGVIAEEVLVQLESNWADYVFAPDYRLKPLAEVEAFIAEEKHLPGVISAREVAENGLNLGEMQRTQMEKIEELFLHVIALEKRVKQLEAENATLKTGEKH